MTTTVTERYVYSGFETVCKYDGSDVWKQDFVFDVTGIDAVLMLQQSDVLDYDGDSNTTEATRSYYHGNALGSVVQLTDPLQAVIASYQYSPYGEVSINRLGQVVTADPLGQHWSYTGRFLDEETGQLAFRTRVLAPANGRFLSRDWIGYHDGANQYVYVRCAPTVYVDPLGLLSLQGFRDALEGAKAMASDLSAGLPEILLTDWGYGAYMAFEKARELSAKYGDSIGQGPANAMRHCIWACELAHRYGHDVADRVTRAHEIRTNDPGIVDTVNNAQGLECARVRESDCEQCCRKKLTATRGDVQSGLAFNCSDNAMGFWCQGLTAIPMPDAPSHIELMKRLGNGDMEKGVEEWKRQNSWRCHNAVIRALRTRDQAGDPGLLSKVK
jgi:RHS repeat-associated protein